MTKNTNLQQEEMQTKKHEGTFGFTPERQAWQYFPEHVHIFGDKKEFFETWADKYHGSHFHNLFHIDSNENKFITRPTLKLVPQFWGADAELLEEMVDNGYLGKEYYVIYGTQEEREYNSIPVCFENVWEEEAVVIKQLINDMVKFGVATGIELLVLKEDNKMLFVFTSRFLNEDFVLKNAYSDKQGVAEDYVQTLKEIEELKRKKELYEEWFELK